MLRGIIASTVQFGHERGMTTFSGGPSLVPLGYYTLYWDKIVIPDSNVVSMQLPGQDVLIETGVISRPMIAVACGDLGEAMRLAQAKAAQELILNDRETDWTIHQIGSFLDLPPEFQREMRTIRVDLQNALPVPDSSVPIVEILEFKYRRRDELGSLHSYLDEAYLEVLNSPDPDLQRKITIARLVKAIEDVHKVSNERWKTTKKYDLSVELNVDGAKLMNAAASTAAFGFFTGSSLTIPLGALAGALSCVKVSAKATKSFEPAKQNLKLGFLSEAHSEGILHKASQERKAHGRVAGVERHQATDPKTQSRMGILSRETISFARSKLAEYAKKRK